MRLATTVCMFVLLSVACRSEGDPSPQLAASASQGPPPVGSGVVGGCLGPRGQLVVRMREASSVREGLRLFVPLLRNAVWEQKVGHVSASAFVFDDGKMALFDIAVQMREPEGSVLALRRLLRELKVPERTLIEEAVGDSVLKHAVWADAQ